MVNLEKNLNMGSCKAYIKGTKLEKVERKTGIYFRSGRNKKLDSFATEICKMILK